MNLESFFRGHTLQKIPLTQYLIIGPLIISSLIAVYFFGTALRVFIVEAQAMSALRSQQHKAEASIQRLPLPAGELARYRDIMARSNPSIQIVLNPDTGGFTVSVADPKLYNEWLFALYGLQSYGKNVLWDVSRLCLKCGNTAATAVVQGYTQSVRLN